MGQPQAKPHEDECRNRPLEVTLSALNLCLCHGTKKNLHGSGRSGTGEWIRFGKTHFGIEFIVYGGSTITGKPSRRCHS